MSVEVAETVEIVVMQQAPDELVAHREAIAAHWSAKQIENPRYFNGGTILATSIDVTAGVARINAFRSDFATYLYLRAKDWTVGGIANVFGTGLLIPDDGGLLVATGAPGTVNEGRLYLPGGFIDEQDLRGEPAPDVGAAPRTVVDVDCQILRELREETGLSEGALSMTGPYLIAAQPGDVSVARVVRCTQSGEDVLASTRDTNAVMSVPELIAPRFLRASDLGGVQLLPYAGALARHLAEQGAI